MQKPTVIPDEHKWCPGCTAVLSLTSFGPDRSRPPLYLQGRCRGCVSRANSVRRRQIETPEQIAVTLAHNAREHAGATMPCEISAAMLQPFPPVCVLTLDDLIEGDSPQPPALAMLVDGYGFTAENTVVISAQARRRHRVIGAKAIREHLGKADVLPAVAVATLMDALVRHNSLAWAVEADAIAAEVDGLTTDAGGYLVVPANGRRAKDAQADRRQHFVDLIDGQPYSRPFAAQIEHYDQYVGWTGFVTAQRSAEVEEAQFV